LSVGIGSRLGLATSAVVATPAPLSRDRANHERTPLTAGLASRDRAVAQRVVVADDDVLVRAGIVSVLFAAGHEVVGEAGDGDELIRLVSDCKPNLAVLDIRMPPTQTWEGIEVARVLRKSAPDVGILLLSAHVELETAIDLLDGDTGRGTGYLLKSRLASIDDLTDAVARIAAGGSVIDPLLVQELLAQNRRTDPLSVLTNREREILALVAEGRSNSGVGQALFISDGAVEKHVRSILSKLDLPEAKEDHRRVLAVLTFLNSA
jgi:DNA-binding NarL/FixJ family response regulator